MSRDAEKVRSKLEISSFFKSPSSDISCNSTTSIFQFTMSDHHHHHGDGGHCQGEHDHSNDITPAIQSLLYSQIDFDAITTLNGIVD